jgi:2-iminobutanoate/2-iminopropanoate deaminase
MKNIIFSPSAPAPIGPYSQAVAVNGMLYVSGQIPIDQASGTLVSGDISKETRQVMENLKHILTAAGISFEEVVKCSIFMTSMQDYAAIKLSLRLARIPDYFVRAGAARRERRARTFSGLRSR